MLLKDLYCESGKLGNIEITGITCNSKEVRPGFAFVCLKGANSDGHKFAPDALKSGAAVIFAETDLGFENQIIVKDTHETYFDLSAKWFREPTKELKLIGVTGTNGKTSVTYMLKSIFEKAGYKTGLIGTIQNMIGEKAIETHNTTPDAFTLNKLFREMVDSGCKYAVMEVSSHALDQKRICNVTFETAIFTNLTQDHLDYHKTMDNYLLAKKKLFKMCKKAVLNSDDPYFEKLKEGLACEIITYSASNNSDYSAKGINYHPSGVEYELVAKGLIKHISVNTGGRFSVYNSLCSAVTAIENGIDIDTVVSALKELKGVKGRAEVVETGRNFTVIIDYAHTPDGLKNILSTFKECKKGRLVALFGCGGDRDKTKRPIMGNIAVHNADYVIVTSDNPRSENPTAIINDILEGIKGIPTPVKVIENRIEAIKFAVSNARKDDIIVLAGKGHETYQILNTGTIHLDEREVVKEALSELNDGGEKE